MTYSRIPISANDQALANSLHANLATQDSIPAAAREEIVELSMVAAQRASAALMGHINLGSCDKVRLTSYSIAVSLLRAWAGQEVGNLVVYAAKECLPFKGFAVSTNASADTPRGGA